MTGFTRNLVLQCIIIFLGSTLPYGYHFAALNLPTGFIKDFYNTTYTERGTHLTSYLLTFLFSLTVTMLLIGMLCGTLLAGCFSKRMGRKKMTLAAQIPQIFGSVLQSICLVIRSPESLMVGRFFSGLASGMAMQIGPSYVSELSPPNIRGTMNSVGQVIICSAILLSGILGLDTIFGTTELWPCILAVPVIPSVICAVALILLVESPTFLLLDQHNQAAAEKALQFVRQDKDVKEEINEMKKEAESLESGDMEKYTLLKLMRSKEHQLPLLLAFLIPLCIQATGMSGVFLYITGIFKNIGLRDDEIQYSVLGTYLALFVGTLLFLYLVDRLGRRPLLIFPLAMITVLLLTLTLCNYFQNTVTWLSYIGVVCTILFCLLYSAGPGSLVWLIPPELFKQGPRDVALSFSVTTIWASMLLLSLTFELMVEAMDYFVFLLFMALTFCFTLVFYWKMPETKNKTFKEIADILSGKKPTSTKDETKLCPKNFEL